MPYPIIQRELTVHLHNKNWFLRLTDINENILGHVDYGYKVNGLTLISQ